jgi:hypothetical protein
MQCLVVWVMLPISEIETPFFSPPYKQFRSLQTGWTGEYVFISPPSAVYR